MRAMAVLCLLLSGALFTGQRLTYPESHHVEWPGIKPRNQWQQAFLWIRDNTPSDAIFALDNDYIESPGEDAQGFRATAERSTVADWFKDGGIASNFPEAATLWWQGSTATRQLNRASDQQRLARLQPLGVTWIVLPVEPAPASREAKTGFPCPFANARVRVCRLSGFAIGIDRSDRPFRGFPPKESHSSRSLSDHGNCETALSGALLHGADSAK
jgi:hypothetical protein